MARNKALSSETRPSIRVLKNEGCSMREIAKKLKISKKKLCATPFTDQRKLSLTRIERGVGGPGAQLSKRTSTLEFLV
jgi:transcriptional regulator with XRE-family HTH domain